MLFLRPGRVKTIGTQHVRKPEWLKIRLPEGDLYNRIKQISRRLGLSTVCEEAKCPNIGECWSQGSATYMLMGDTCTRACRFCAVKSGEPKGWLDSEEPQKIAESVKQLGLKYVVLTSVDRDDLPDGGADHFAKTVELLKETIPDIIVEVLIPDFQGRLEPLERIMAANPDVIAQNIETVRRLTHHVRDRRSGYQQTLTLLKRVSEKSPSTASAASLCCSAASFTSVVNSLPALLAPCICSSHGTSQTPSTTIKARRPDILTKSSIMLGLGESNDEIIECMQDLREHNVDLLTLGQYLQPTTKHLPVERFVTPEEFKALEKVALDMGFLYAASGPLVRSSYKAAEFFLSHLHKTAFTQEITEDSRNIEQNDFLKIGVKGGYSVK